MRQDYKLCALNKKGKKDANKGKIALAITSWTYDNGAKLMEFSYIGNDFVNAFEQAINKESGEYAGKPVVCAGDYADEEEKQITKTEAKTMGFDKEHMELVVGEYPSIYALANVWENKNGRYAETGKHYRYIINEDKKLFIDTNRLVPDQDGFIIHPLPLLICEGNGEGLGDYHGTCEDKVGTWARDVVVTSDNRPDKTYKEVLYKFKEKTD